MGASSSRAKARKGSGVGAREVPGSPRRGEADGAAAPEEADGAAAPDPHGLHALKESHVADLTTKRAAATEGFARELAELSATPFEEDDINDIRHGFARQVSDVDKSHCQRLAMAHDDRMTFLSTQIDEATTSKRALDMEIFQLRAVLTDSEQQLQEQEHAISCEEAEIADELSTLHRNDFELCNRLGNAETELHRARADAEASRLLAAQMGRAQMEASAARRREQDDHRHWERELSDRSSAMLREISAVRQRDVAATVFVPAHFEDMDREMTHLEARAHRLKSQAVMQMHELARVQQKEEEIRTEYKAVHKRVEALSRDGYPGLAQHQKELQAAQEEEASLMQMIEELQDEVRETVSLKALDTPPSFRSPIRSPGSDSYAVAAS